VRCAPENVLITNGAKHATDLALRTFAETGDRIIVTSPTYMTTLQCMRTHGVSLLAIEQDDEGMRTDLLERRLDTLERNGERMPKLLFDVPDFHNPTGITMHHTGFPDLSIRPNGFTEQHMLNMRHGYINDNGWHRGPHIYTDDHGIWVFNPLSRRGVHAVSYNSTRYGIEILGNFDTEADFASLRGASSRKNGMFAAAVLMKHAGISTAKLNFHHHDPETRKTCPGRHVNFSEFEQAVLEIAEKI